MAWRSRVFLARLRKQPIGLNRGCPRISRLYGRGLMERTRIWSLRESRGGVDQTSSEVWGVTA
jgi:hypothetical protein